MNRGQPGRWNLSTLLALLVVSLVCGLADAQIGNDIKTAANVTSNAPAIDATVKKDVAALAASPTLATRNILINNALVPGSAASPAFLDAYTVSLNTHLQALAKDPNLTVRLNGAIVAAQVAQIANNARLAQAVTAFINDKSEPVAVWGLRGAKPIIPNLLKGPNANPKDAIFPAVINAVKTHHTGLASGWIASDAYLALALELSAQPGKTRPTVDMIKQTIGPVQDLLAVRIAQYKEGVPASPTADQLGTGYLSNPTVWPNQTPAQQLRSMQLFSDLLALAAQQQAAPQVKDQDRSELITLIKLVSGAIAVNADKGSPLAIAATDVSTITKVMTPEEIKKKVDGVHPAIIKDAKYKTVTPPPAIVDTKPAPAPTTAPTTLPAAGAIPPPPPVPPPAVPPPAEKPAPAPGPGRPPPNGGAGRPPPPGR